MEDRLVAGLIFLAVSPLTLLFFVALAVAGALFGRRLGRHRGG